MKQETRNKFLLISLVALSAALGLTLFLKSAQNTSTVNPDTYRQVDLKKIDRVLMESTKGKVALEYNNNSWKVNDGATADRNLVEVLFATLKQAEPKRPVATSMQDSIRNVLSSQGVKVSLYSGDVVEESFYAGGNAEKTEAYFMKPQQEAHVVTIPGYRVYVSGIFELAAANWREKLVFDFNWRNFKNLQVTFLNEKGNFEVTVNKNMAAISGINEPDTARLNTFLDQVSLLTVEEYLDDQALQDSLQKIEPIAKFTIEDIARRTYDLKVFNRGKQFFALVKGNVAILDERKIIPLLRPKEFFVKR
jgi:hypothetical protein